MRHHHTLQSQVLAMAMLIINASLSFITTQSSALAGNRSQLLAVSSSIINCVFQVAIDMGLINAVLGKRSSDHGSPFM